MPWCSSRHCVSQHTCFSACTHTRRQKYMQNLSLQLLCVLSCMKTVWVYGIVMVSVGPAMSCLSKSLMLQVFFTLYVWKYEILHGATAYWAWALHVHAMSVALTLFQGHSNCRQFNWWFCFLIHLSSNAVSWLLITSCRWLTYLQIFLVLFCFCTQGSLLTLYLI